MGALGHNSEVLFFSYFAFALCYVDFTRGRKCCLAAGAEEREVWAVFAAQVRRWSLQTSRAGDEPRVLKLWDPFVTQVMPPTPTTSPWSTQQHHVHLLGLEG